MKSTDIVENLVVEIRKQIYNDGGFTKEQMAIMGAIIVVAKNKILTQIVDDLEQNQ